MVHTPGSHLLTTNQTQIISKTRTHRSQQSILLQLFFATQCYTSGSEIWDLHAKLGLFWDQIWTLVPFGTKSQIWDFIGTVSKRVLILRTWSLIRTFLAFWVLIYISGSLFSLFWFHSRKECQFSLHV